MSSLKPWTLRVDEADLQRALNLAKDALKLLPENDSLQTESGPGPDGQPTDEYGYGLPLERLRELANHLVGKYDWRKEETRIQEMGEHHTLIFEDSVEGPMEIHFVHCRSKRADAIPLLLSHGWPGSFIEFAKISELLANPPEGEAAFHCVMPSIPGYTFSSKPRKSFLEVKTIASAFNQVMKTLKYEKYVAQGGDWGSLITRCIAQLYPDNCVAIHLNLVHTSSQSPGAASQSQTEKLTSDEERGQKRFANFDKYGSAYSAMQGTVPYTLGAALSFNPVSLLAYIGEKMYRWSDPESHPSRDEIITNTLLYWFSRSIVSSFWLYYNRSHGGDVNKVMDTVVSVPTAFACGRHEIRPSEEVIRKLHPKLLSYEVLEHGGHFLALEQPDLLAKNMRKHFTSAQVKQALSIN